MHPWMGGTRTVADEQELLVVPAAAFHADQRVHRVMLCVLHLWPLILHTATYIPAQRLLRISLTMQAKGLGRSPTCQTASSAPQPHTWLRSGMCSTASTSPFVAASSPSSLSHLLCVIVLKRALHSGQRDSCSAHLEMQGKQYLQTGHTGHSVWSARSALNTTTVVRSRVPVCTGSRVHICAGCRGSLVVAAIQLP